MIGRVLSNRYELLERVGGGGMAFVYRARDVRLNRIVAVKVLSPHFTSDEDFVRKFRREAQAAASLSSPSIVGVFDVGQDGDVHYIVMEFLHGKTLKQVINEKGHLAVPEVLQIGTQIAEALQVAHKHGVIHRDIKPHNIMLTTDGRVKVTDFGIARAVTGSTLTETGTMVGSVHYISPEQARGGIVGELSDIYSLGVVLYELLTGQVPFEGDSMFSIALKHLQEQPRPVRELNPSVPAAVERIVLKAMSKEQASRYQSAGEMAADLKRLLLANDQQVSLQGLVGELEPPTQEPAELEKTRVAPAPNGAEQEEPPPSKRGRRPWWHYLLLGGGLTLLATLVALFIMFRPGAVVEVPNVVGLSLSDAQRILADHKLGFMVGLELYSDEDPNVVLDQDLPEGRKVRAGRVITLTISKGPEYADVPDVVGKSLREARIELQNAGFEIAEPINRVYSDKPPETVVGQNPSGNTRLKRSSQIILTVSQGPEPQPFAMPNLQGLTAMAAQQRLSELQLTLGDISGPTDGVVISQSPAADTQVVPGQTVSLVLGPKQVSALVSYTVPEDSEDNNHRIEILREDLNGLVLLESLRLKRGETVQRNVSGVGFLRIIVKDEGVIVKEEVYP
ncbi:MAG: Stk1 family PASTA domain-containing Ser/Thr kinase [Firmicutes bacterium]|nr:Stk1 family PASTA domain-containing Ser/Thr kinase [Bacillota bacterium]